MLLERQERLPPQSIEAEEAVLGSILIDREAIGRIAPFLRDSDFYRERNREIFAAALTLYDRREPIDLLTLKDELERRGKLEELGGAAYLASLSTSVPTSAHVEYYARIVERTAILRRLIGAAGQIAALGYESSDELDTILDRAEQLLFGVSQRRLTREYVSLHAALKEYFDTIDFLHQHKGEVVGVPTGFRDLDQMTGGLHASDLIIVAGRPAVGKTSFVLTVAHNAAVKHRAPVAIFSLEMSVEQLVQRLLCSEAAVDAHRLRTGFIDEFEWHRISQAFGVLSEAPIYIDDTANITTLELRAKARRMKAEHGIQLLIVDYLQLMQGRGLENRVQEVSEISRGLKGLARELDVPVIALSQLSRAVESRQDHRPVLSDLRESGCLAGDTLILDPLTGRPQRIDSFVGRSGQQVWAVDSRLQIGDYAVSDAFCTGIMPVYEVSLASGRRIKATANHPFRTVDGWVPLAELDCGSFIATARSVPEPRRPTRMDEREIVLLAHLIGDGCVVPRQPIHYTSADPACIEAVVEAAAIFGIRPRTVAQSDWWHVYLPSPTHLTHRRSHPITDWMRGLGIGPRRSWEKELPAAIFSLPTDQLALFLRHLWSTDGNISRRQRARVAIYYATTSRALAEQLQLLLLRFGIVARLATVSKAGYRPCYHVRVSGASDQLRFLREIGCFGRRGEIAQELIDELCGVSPNTNVDVIPRAVWNHVREAKDRAALSWRDVAAGLQVSYCGSTLFKRGLSRQRLARVATCVADESLAQLARSDVYWDCIKSIRPGGHELVYDLTVPGVHNFLANGMFVHNSIEQDADIVLFLHREELYKRDTERKNIADVIVAKHRNGPTGEVALRFFPSQTRFADLERFRQAE